MENLLQMWNLKIVANINMSKRFERFNDVIFTAL